jgi:hypothetical protein
LKPPPLSPASGIVSPHEIGLSGIENTLEHVEFFGGATVVGVVPFSVNLDSVDLILFYESILEPPLFMELPG